MSSGRDLGVDLYELWHAGKNLLPVVAEEFSVAHGTLSSGSMSNPAYRGGGIGTEGSYGAGSAIMALGDVLEGYLARTNNNLYYTGQALVDAANTYEGADSAAIAEFEKRKKEMGEG